MSNRRTIRSRVTGYLNRAIENVRHGTNETTELRPYASDLATAYANDWKGIPCVFVLSTGRVGTQTLSALLNLSPNVKAHHEPAPRLIKASFDAFMTADDARQSETWKRLVLAARDDFVLDAARTGHIYVETNNRMTYLAPALSSIFPDSHFIHLHRHPFDVIRSAMRRGYYTGHSWDFARISPRPSDPESDEWITWQPIEKVAWYWAKVNSDIEIFMQSIPGSRRLTLPSEHLFAQNDDAISSLFKFVDAQLPNQDKIRSILSTRLNAQVRGDFPTAEKWSERDRQSVLRLVQFVAGRLGYTLET